MERGGNMNLVDKINNPLKRHHKKPSSSAGQIIKLIRTNQYDPTNRIHVYMKNTAIRQGYIDEELNIMKEVT